MSAFKHRLRELYVRYIKRDEKEIAYYDFIAAGGEKLRLDYPLTPESIVLDVGGYIGDFAVDISDKFNCKVDVFEPVESYAEQIKERVTNIEKIEVLQVGLGGREREEFITVEGLGSSVFVHHRDEETKEKIKIISIVDYLQSKNYPEISLMKLNIEGGEFELLDALLNHSELLMKIKYFQIQFHDFVPSADEKMQKLQMRLSKTHQKTWGFPFIWESWRRIK